MLLENVLSLASQQKCDETSGAGRVRRIAQNRHGVDRLRIDPSGRGDRGNLSVGALSRIEEARIELSGLDAADEGLLREYLRRIIGCTQHLLSEAGFMVKVFCRGHELQRQGSLGIELCVRAPDPDAWFGKYLVPGFGLE